MKTLSIDIETYSGTDHNKCGVYKYAEDPDFEILLFGYAVDGGEVQVVDLTLGDTIPDDVLSALEDEKVIKTAFNANFERVCLSRFLGYRTGEYLEPESWRCTMVWSAYMGSLTARMKRKQRSVQGWKASAVLISPDYRVHIIRRQERNASLRPLMRLMF